MARTTKPEFERPLLAALAVCCAVPMIGIIVATSVVGVALGTAAAVAIGLVAAGVCAAVMYQHHRPRPDRTEREGPHHGH